MIYAIDAEQPGKNAHRQTGVVQGSDWGVEGEKSQDRKFALTSPPIEYRVSSCQGAYPITAEENVTNVSTSFRIYSFIIYGRIY